MANQTDPKIFENITKPTRYRASYVKKEFTVTWKNWDGSTIRVDTVGMNTGATPPTSPTRPGYSFKGWDISYGNIENNTVITAVFNVSTYLVKWVNWNGTVIKSEQVEHGKAATPPTVPARSGYRFDKWDKLYSSVTSDMNINAKFVMTFNVTWKNWDDTTIKTETVDSGSSATPPSNPVRDGYKFTGWDSQYSQVYSTMTITATYEQEVTIKSFSLHIRTRRGQTMYPLDGTSMWCGHKLYDYDETQMVSDDYDNLFVNQRNIYAVTDDGTELSSQDFTMTSSNPTLLSVSGNTLTGNHTSYTSKDSFDVVITAKYKGVTSAATIKAYPMSYILELNMSTSSLPTYSGTIPFIGNIVYNNGKLRQIAGHKTNMAMLNVKMTCSGSQSTISTPFVQAYAEYFGKHKYQMACNVTNVKSGDIINSTGTLNGTTLLNLGGKTW